MEQQKWPQISDSFFFSHVIAIVRQVYFLLLFSDNINRFHHIFCCSDSILWMHFLGSNNWILKTQSYELRRARLYKCHCSGLSAARRVCVPSVAILLTFHVVNRNVVYLFTSVCSALIELSCVLTATPPAQFVRRWTKDRSHELFTINLNSEELYWLTDTESV